MGEVKAVDISPDGKTLVSASADGTLKAWDMETEKLMYTCTGHKDEVTRHCRGLKQSKCFPSCIYGLSSVRCQWFCSTIAFCYHLNVPSLSFQVWSCTISEDGELLASGSKDGTIRLWKLATGQHLCSFQVCLAKPKQKQLLFHGHILFHVRI